MRRVYQAAALAFLVVASYVMFEARRYEYYLPLGPGPGFFPFWIGAILAVLSLGWLGQVSLRPVQPKPIDFVPDRSGKARVLGVFLALCLFVAFVDRMGYSLTMFLFSLGLLVGIGRRNVVLSLLISLVGSFGLYYVFMYWLQVPLPASPIEFLQDVGF